MRNGPSTAESPPRLPISNSGQPKRELLRHNAECPGAGFSASALDPSPLIHRGPNRRPSGRTCRWPRMHRSHDLSNGRKPGASWPFPNWAAFTTATNGVPPENTCAVGPRRHRPSVPACTRCPHLPPRRPRSRAPTNSGTNPLRPHLPVRPRAGGAECAQLSPHRLHGISGNHRPIRERRGQNWVAAPVRPRRMAEPARRPATGVTLHVARLSLFYCQSIACPV